MEDLDIDKTKAEFLKTFQGVDGKVKNPDMANDIINYVCQQINEFSNCGNINELQHANMLDKAVEGLYIKVYIEHYVEGEELLDKKPIEVAATNFMMLMYSLVKNGAVYKLKFEEIRAKQQITINQGR